MSWAMPESILGFSSPACPQRARPSSGATRIVRPGGKGLNQAIAAARAGARVRFLAPLGQDADGMEVARALEAEPFDGIDLPRLPCPTDRSILMLTPDGENCIVTAGACADALDPTLARHFAEAVQPGDILLLQGNLSLPATRAAIDANPGHTILNAAPLRWDVRPLLPSCTALVANLGEAQSLTGSRSARCPARGRSRVGDRDARVGRVPCGRCRRGAAHSRLACPSA